MKRQPAWEKYIALLVGCLLLWGLNSWLFDKPAQYTDIACIVLLLGVAALVCTTAIREKGGSAELYALAGFVVGAIFVLQLSYNFSWHDLASYHADFSGEAKPDGHLGYIAYLVEYGRLPTENPMAEGYSIFYNPPLFHLLEAGFVRLNLAMKVSLGATLENMQVITLFFSSACTLVIMDLMRLFKLSERAVRVGMQMVAVQPSLLILGATLNNDILSILCILLCLLFTIRWYQSRRMHDILSLAAALGAGMATKLSVALVIPCIALVFAVCFFCDQTRWKRYLGQFAAFLGVSVPPAVAWPLYHAVAFQMPLNYVRLPAETINVAGYSLWERFGIPNAQAIRSLFYTGIRKVDHNVWMQTIKTGMYDELTLFEKGTVGWYASYALMILFAALLLVSLVLFVRMLLRRNEKLPFILKLFFGSYGALLMGNYIKFCADYPYICSFNFRYIAPILALCALAWAFLCDERKSKRVAWTEVAAGLFDLGVCAVYGAYFFLG